jgi:ribonuclease E
MPMAESQPEVREQPPKSPAVSLWHKIFGMPSEPTPPVESVEVREEASASMEITREVEGESDSIEVRSLSGDEVSAAGFIEDQPTADLAAEEETEQSERKRGRSRRRRRGGRGRRGDRSRDSQSSEPLVHESAGTDDLNAGFDDLGADEDDLSGGELGAADGDSDLEGFDDEESSRDSRAMTAAQRAIPSWDDVIGFIVDSNMQTRTQRRPPGRSESRGGSPRGRSRGGRRNK